MLAHKKPHLFQQRDQLCLQCQLQFQTPDSTIIKVHQPETDQDQVALTQAKLKIKHQVASTQAKFKIKPQYKINFQVQCPER